MWKWISRLTGRERVAELESENAHLKSVMVAGSIMPSGSSFNTVDMGHHREQLRHLQGWVYTAVRIISQRIMGQPVHVARENAKGELTDVPNHPLALALANPNELMTAATLILNTVAAMEITGRSYWLVSEENGRDTIFPLPPHWVRPTIANGRFVSYDVYPEGKGYGVGKPVTVPGEQILQLYYPSPSDPFDALSPLQAASMAVSSDESLQTSQYRAFKNGIFPGLAIRVGHRPDAAPGAPRTVLTNEQRQSIIDAVRKRWGGVVNSDAPIILDGLIESIEKISLTPKEMEWLKSGMQTKSRILQAFGVNPILAGEIEGANRASAAVADENFCAVTINPKIELISQMMTSWFAEHYNDPSLVVYIEPARPRDQESRRADLELLAKHGALEINELRAAFGFEKVPWGAQPVIVGKPIPDVQPGQEGSAPSNGKFFRIPKVSANGSTH